MSEFPARFDPLRQPSSKARAVVLLTGPLLWLGALVAWAIVVRETRFLLVGLAIAGGSVLLGGATLLVSRAHRLREEREPAPGR